MNRAHGSKTDELASLLIAGDRRAIARSITMIENGDPLAEPLLRELYPHTGGAYRIGITGPLGSGKSTLTNRLAAHFTGAGSRVGIIAVDPTSPFTGGAVLGDRIRMADVETNANVFIRSMAARGSLGGLSRKSREAADVLDAAGKDVIFLETVGVGQSEIDIVRASDITVVVLVPESGDSIQAMKAGLMEIADIFVVNKSDRSGADQAAAAIESILAMRTEGGRRPPVVKAVAVRNEGIRDICGELDAFRTETSESGRFHDRRLESLAERVDHLVTEKLYREFWNGSRRRYFDEQIHAVRDYKTSPYDLADRMIEHFNEERTS
jgi:LAO/AO transport system kinase